MNTPNWSAVKALFEAALAQSAEERERFVIHSGAEAAVVAEALSLLRHHAATGDSFMAEAAPRHEGPAAQPGQRLGAWELQELLGSGGMGEVWLARRADGAYEGEAAIKLLKRGMDSAAVLARFAQERQALARLDHPHVARLFDAGLSPQGLPFFVMERVQGQTLDRACAGLDLEARLALFLQLTDAVAHAHRHLLVHRDLKPSNVLVNNEGQVKLLDFGIAKALDPLEGADAAEQTQAGQRAFTPSHASPEQIRGEPVSTATDIYSLGVLLYQLLTGQRPYGRSAHSAAEQAQAALHENPTRPSSLSPPPGSAPPHWLATRQRLRGDLDNILLKALEKEPERRYASVEQFAADLRAHLAGYPVSAHAPSRRYLWAKFARRNRLAVGLGLGAALALSTGLAVASWQAHVARQARAAAELRLSAVKGITADLVFRFGDAITYLPGGRKAQDALLAQTLEALAPLVEGEQPDGALQALSASILARRAELLGNDTTGTAELAAETDTMARRAIELGERLWAEHKGDWRFAQWHARVLQVQSVRQRNAGQSSQAQASIRLAIERLEQARPLAQHDVLGRAGLGVELANTTLSLGQTLSSAGQEAEALALYAKAEPVYRELLADTAMHTEYDRRAGPGEIKSEVYMRHQLGVALASRALTLLRLDRVDEAHAQLQATLPLRRANVEAEPANIAWRDGLLQEAHTLAGVQLRRGEWAAALESSTLAWEENERLSKQEGPKSKWAQMPRTLALSHARALWRNGRPQEALKVIERGQVLWRAASGQGRNPGAELRRASLDALHGAVLQATRQAGAEAALRAALQALQPLFTDPQVGRPARLAWAEAAQWLLAQHPADAASLREAALNALDQAATKAPLAADHQAMRAALQG
ncbi:tRNA A-37 threonylcarbamoyl transferase component Bud32 [Inhella inkyongensis]|uniref:tRNA A-37 threonylcarbamoyl transferase component Bud32 n=1 Tax=Inhella inkyongensis TaxID=392593 RepID=A0A840S2S8_9BURK|nr:serine/threonine-protein kinase [Inhella inkyongensis]MBB5202849.1 tRNA A-37 threonylcarbamoyl transferase component Bud32 [Inhella inkyongensis]